VETVRETIYEFFSTTQSGSLVDFVFIFGMVRITEADIIIDLAKVEF